MVCGGRKLETSKKHQKLDTYKVQKTARFIFHLTLPHTELGTLAKTLHYASVQGQANIGESFTFPDKHLAPITAPENEARGDSDALAWHFHPAAMVEPFPQIYPTGIRYCDQVWPWLSRTRPDAKGRENA